MKALMINREPEIAPDIKEKILPILARRDETLLGNLGIDYISLSKDKVVASMPVDKRTKQPFGLLHGGASVSLAESLASIGAWLNIDDQRFNCVGIEINANHMRAVTDGRVIGTATPIHRGRSTHVWEVRIVNEVDNSLVCISRCTLAVVERKTV